MARKSRVEPVPWDKVKPGKSRELFLSISESYSGISTEIPLHVQRGRKDGPTVFVTAALHGDEINGTGAIRELIRDPRIVTTAGTLVLVPVVNLPGFERHSRYLPDRRDLNRSFPGARQGSLAGRLAHTIFDRIVRHCDYGIDLHTAAVRRTNFPNVRADMSRPDVRLLAKSFGGELIVNAAGKSGMLRYEACKAGCPTIIFEGGEVWKVEPAIVSNAVAGVTSALSNLGVISAPIRQPSFQFVIDRTRWIRAERGGFLQFHVSPGMAVAKGTSLATNTALVGGTKNVLEAPFDGIVIGMTTLPAVSPGEPVFHVGRIGSPKQFSIIKEHSTAARYRKTVKELGSSIMLIGSGVKSA